MNNLFRSNELEERFFIIVLACSFPYYIFNLLIIFVFAAADPELVTIYCSLMLISILLLYIASKRKSNTILINVFVIAILTAFIYYMPKAAGPSGGLGYALQNIIVLLILLTKGYMRYFIAISLSAICLILFTDVLTFHGYINYKQLIIDYVVNLIFIAVFMVFFKFNFDNDQDKLLKKNLELENMYYKLSLQVKELEDTNEEIQAIRDNLQQKITERTEKLEKENEKLLEYSFINAHLVRAPIANILGLTQLEYSNPRIKEIKKSVQEMDEIVRRIAKVLN
ncbi:hypothetical protein [Ekhidna sp.]